MIFISFVNLLVIQMSEQVKLSSDDEILSKLIKKSWCTCNFLNHIREAKQP